MAVSFKRLGLHRGRVVDDGEDPAPLDAATVEHVRRLADNTAA